MSTAVGETTGPASPQSPGVPEPAAPPAHEPSPTRWGRLPEAAVAAAIGMALIAVADTGARHGAGWGTPFYWAGITIGFAAVGGRLLIRSRLGTCEPLGLAIIVAAFSFLTKVFYSPLAFQFPDELQHWRSTYDVLTTHKLFTPNPALPISPHYPGLELAAASLSSVTGMSIFASGIAITAVAHVTLVAALYCLFTRLSGSGRVGAIGVLAYSMNAHFSSFDAMFLYQALGLTFLAGVLLATTAAVGEQSHSGRWTILAALMLAAAVVTHHVTSYLLVVALAGSAIIAAARRRDGAARWRTVRITGGLALYGVLLVAGWIAAAAPQTIDYLRSPVSGIIDSARRLLLGMSATTQAAEQVAPLADRAVGVAAALLVAALLPLAWLSLRRTKGDGSLGWRGSGAVALMVASAGYYLVLVIRVGVTDGQELAGRLMSFEFIPVAYALALLAVSSERVVHAAARDLCALGAGGLLTYGAVVSGWPPAWERLPGPYLVAGFERSVDAQALAVAAWAPRALGPSQRFGADAGNAPIIGTYGRQDVVRNLAPLYTSSSPTAADIALARTTAVRYLLVDERMAQQLPASGAYFPVDPNANRYRHPLPLAPLEKFDSAGASRLYDSGDIVVYDLQGSDYAP